MPDEPHREQEEYEVSTSTWAREGEDIHWLLAGDLWGTPSRALPCRVFSSVGAALGAYAKAKARLPPSHRGWSPQVSRAGQTGPGLLQRSDQANTALSIDVTTAEFRRHKPSDHLATDDADVELSDIG